MSAGARSQRAQGALRARARGREALDDITHDMHT
jgi:hypothetical protein